MAFAGEKNPLAEELNDARDDLEKKIGGVSFGFGVSRADVMTALERFIDASIDWKMNRRY